MRWLALIVSFVTVSFSPPSWADAKFNLGKQKAKVCMTCHGEKGISKISTYPKLQGQHIDYQVAALKSYKKRQRNGGLANLMHAYADKLSEKDMQDIAYYYNKAGQKR